MPKKKQSPHPSSDGELDAFALQVEQTLNHFADAGWIGKHSPLAAPYFLGRALTLATPRDSARERGETLKRVILQAAAQLDGELHSLLQVAYFQSSAKLDNAGVAMRLHMSERTFYRARVRAVQALAQALNQLVVPALRAEMPSERRLIGRERTLAAALAALHRGHSVYVSGPSGVGKTTVGTNLVRRWVMGHGLSHHAASGQSLGAGTERHAFWYTLRAGLNDQVASLLFALGYFLRSLGAGHTWRQLVADRGVANPERVLGLLRYDLNSLHPSPPLLCIDDIDVLHAEISEHAHTLHLLEELRTHCPMLFIGQQVVMEASQQLRLQGFNEQELENLLAQVNAPPLPESLRARLLNYTRGNPALVLLFTTLVADGDDPETTLQAIATAPSLEALFHRIWRRLNEEERYLLMQLAVFRNHAPIDAWQAEQGPSLARLRQRELLDLDDTGGVQCDPHLQPLIYARIPAELKPLLHIFAADVRETRAEYLAAMYHAVEGRQPARAVWLWMTHRNDEIDRGAGAVALGLLHRISPGDLADERDRNALRIGRAELLHLTGRQEEAEQELQATTTPAQSVLRVYVRRYEGYVLDAQGRLEQALDKFRESLDTIAGLPQFNEVVVHSRLSFLSLYRLHNVEQARKEALIARAKADGVLGDVELMAGHYAVALEYFLSAKAHAEQSGSDLLTLSRIYSFLGNLYLRLSDFDNALLYIDRAIECDRKRGDEAGPLYDLLNRANVHLLTGRYEQSYADAKSGLEVAERLKNSYLVAGLAAGVAEAAYSLKQLQQAEYYAGYSLQQEEEFFRAPALVILGMVRQREGSYRDGVKLLTAALENTKQIEDRYTEAYVWLNTGMMHRDEGLVEPARAAFEQAYQIYRDLNLPKDAERAHALYMDLA